MREVVFILSVFALIASSCGEATKKQDETTNREKNDTIIEKGTLTSDIRPNEKLQIGKTYTDNFEYIDYGAASEDDFFFDLKKDGKEILLIDGCAKGKTPILNRGDMVEIQWEIKEGNEIFDTTEWAVKIKKTKDGNVSLFKKKYPKPLRYYYFNEDYSTSLLDEIYKKIEYYLANSKQGLVKVHIDGQNSNLVYSIEDREVDGEKYYVVGISNEFENHTSIIQWIYLSDNLQKIFEYDLPNEKLIEFK